MGADLIGYFLVAKEKNFSSILAARVDAYEKLLKNDLKNIVDGKVPAKRAKELVKESEKLGLETTEFDGMSDDEILQYVAEDMELAKDWALGGGCRDLAEGTFHVGGKAITIQFAGEMSWGDEPDGAGYTGLRALYRLGILGALLEDLKKPGKSLSVGLKDLEKQIKLCDEIQSVLADGSKAAVANANLLDGLANFISEINAILRSGEEVTLYKGKNT